MGNQLTNLPIDPLFEGMVRSRSGGSPVCIRITLPQPAGRWNRLDVKLQQEQYSLRFYEEDEPLDPPEERLVPWQPCTHMRDFEVMDPFGKEPVRIAKGQGLGVLVIEPLSLYMKLWYDPDTGIKEYCGVWSHNPDAKKLYSADLALGYDTLFLDVDGTLHHLCEELDSRDVNYA
jgi:hypothetical protein